MGEIERRLSPELNNHAFRFCLVVNIEDVLERKRLKIKFVAGIVIGRDRFRIRIHHDGFEPEFTQGERGVDAAVIEFNPLADAIGPAAQNHDFALPAFASLVLIPVGRIIIRRVRFEFRSAGIDQSISGSDLFSDSPTANGFFRNAICDCELSIGEPQFFCAEESRNW